MPTAYQECLGFQCLYSQLSVELYSVQWSGLLNIKHLGIVPRLKNVPERVQNLV